jgi:pimeloyl-ACP methyl ester carboxylesterase
MSEQFADVGNGITLCYETFGSPQDEPVLLIMGLGTQMIAWHEDFCAQLAERGFHVVRFDNRDVGRSTRVRGRPPTPAQIIRRRFHPKQYRLEDMAVDTVALLRVLDLSPAHLVGASMGAMIAQTVAAEHPEDVRSLVSIMGSTGHRFRGQPAPALYRAFFARAPADREGYVEYATRLFTRIGSPGFERDPDALRDLAGRAYDRGRDEAATGRQLAAVLASGDRTRRLRSITVPTLVIHGTADQLVRPSGGRATAQAIPGAELMLIEGMGHDLPRGAWPRIIDGIERTARRAATAREAAWSSS